MTAAGPHADELAGVEHSAFFYDGADDYVAGVTSFVEDGLRLGEPVMISVPRTHLELLLPHVDVASPLLRTVPMEELGRNPAWIIPAWLDFLDEHESTGRPSRGVGEPIWGERTPEELVECTRHEELLNVALDAATSFRLLCPYDTRDLPADVIAGACRNHPHIRDEGGPRANALYSLDVEARLTAPLPPVPRRARLHTFAGTGDISPLRRLVVEHAADCGLDGERLEDLAVVISELVANSVDHGGGGGELHHWSIGDRFVVDVRDRGEIRDAMAGRLRPDIGRGAGRGLWLVNQLCDLVQVRVLPDGRQAVRIHLSA